jgi:hypothetical protein
VRVDVAFTPGEAVAEPVGIVVDVVPRFVQMSGRAAVA